jgi:hypothetical protein
VRVYIYIFIISSAMEDRNVSPVNRALHMDDLQHSTPKKFMTADLLALPRRPNLSSPINLHIATYERLDRSLERPLESTGRHDGRERHEKHVTFDNPSLAPRLDAAATISVAPTLFQSGGGAGIESSVRRYGASKEENVENYVSNVMHERIAQDRQSLLHSKDVEATLRKGLELSKEYVALQEIKVHREIDSANQIYVDKLNYQHEKLLSTKCAEYDMKMQELISTHQHELAIQLAQLEASHNLKLKEKDSAIEVLSLKLQERENRIFDQERNMKEQMKVNNEKIFALRAKQAEDSEIQERIWKQRIEDTIADCDAKVISLESRYSIECSTKEITVEAKCEAVEDRLKAEYAKKIKKLEKQVTEAARAFALRLQYTEGVLNEARREHQAQQGHHTAQVQSLRDELELKDRRIVRMQVDIDSTNQIRNACIKWKEETSKICSAILHACASISEIPNIDEKEIVQNMLKGLKSSLDATSVNIKIKQQEYKKDNVAINRKQITKVYQTCQKTLQKAESYHVPGVE